MCQRKEPLKKNFELCVLKIIFSQLKEKTNEKRLLFVVCYDE